MAETESESADLKFGNYVRRPPTESIFASEMTIGLALWALGQAITASLSRRTHTFRQHAHRVCHDLYSVWLFAGFGWGCLLTLLAVMPFLRH